MDHRFLKRSLDWTPQARRQTQHHALQEWAPNCLSVCLPVCVCVSLSLSPPFPSLSPSPSLSIPRSKAPLHQHVYIPWYIWKSLLQLQDLIEQKKASLFFVIWHFCLELKLFPSRHFALTVFSLFGDLCALSPTYPSPFGWSVWRITKGSRAPGKWEKRRRSKNLMQSGLLERNGKRERERERKTMRKHQSHQRKPQKHECRDGRACLCVCVCAGVRVLTAPY